MKVSNASNNERAAQLKDNEDLLKRLNKSVEKKINTKQMEIKDIDALYDKKIELAKEDGEKDYMQSLERNQNKIAAESNVFEEKLQSYREQLTKAQENVFKEESNLKGDHKLKLSNLKRDLEDNFQDQYSSLQENQDNVQSSTQNAIKELATKSKAEKQSIENNSQFEINTLSSEFNQKAANNEKNFRDTLDTNMRLHNAEIAQQKSDLQKLATIDAEKNKRMSAEKARVNKDQLTFQDKYQQQMLTQRSNDFKTRYETLVKEHDKILQELSTHFEADVKKMVEKTSTDKKKIEDRVSDPFYRVDKLNPKLKVEEKEVVVTLPIADYEKENVHLSAQGRNIKITLTRKYSDDMTDDTDNSLNRSTRSELYSKEFNVADILNPREIVQNYVDGVLTFKIKKA